MPPIGRHRRPREAGLVHRGLHHRHAKKGLSAVGAIVASVGSTAAFLGATAQVPWAGTTPCDQARTTAAVTQSYEPLGAFELGDRFLNNFAPGEKVPCAGTVRVVTTAEPGATPHPVWVYTPEGVAHPEALPVVYFLHGVPGSPADAFLSGLGRALDRYFAAGNPKVLVAVPDGRGEHHADTEWADALDGSDPVETRVMKYALPAVEGNHPRSRSQRAIAGFSMGGAGAMYLGLRHPQQFGQIATEAGYFQGDDPDQMFGADPRELALHRPDAFLGNARDTRIYMVEDRFEPLALVRGETPRLERALAARGLTSSVDFVDGTHDWNFAYKSLPQLLRFFEQGFDRDTA